MFIEPHESPFSLSPSGAEFWPREIGPNYRCGESFLIEIRGKPRLESGRDGLFFGMNAIPSEMKEMPPMNQELTDLPPTDPYVEKVIKATDECIAHHPWGAIGIAIAFGFGIGMLLGRRPKYPDTIRVE
jgi:hypothetical protein